MRAAWLAIAVALGAGACGKSSDAPPGPQERPVKRPSTAAPSGDVIDLVAAGTAAVDASLAAGERREHRFAVQPGRISIRLTHAGGALARMTLRIVDGDQPTVPISTDSATCVEPGCSIGLIIGVAPETRQLLIQIEAADAMTLHLELERLGS